MAPVRDDFWTDPHLSDAQRMLLYKIQNTRKLLDLILVLAKGLVKYGGSWLGSNKNGVDLTLKRVGYRTVEELTGSVETFFKDPVPFEMLPYMHLVSDAMPNRSPSWAVRRASTKRKQ